MKEDAFDSWWNDLEGYGLRSERCFDELRSSNSVQDEIITSWLRAAWNTAIEAAKNKTLNQKGWEDIDGRWIDLDDLYKQLETLKTS